MKLLVVSLRASTETEDIVDYYEDKRPGLGTEFTSHLKKAFLAIRRTPDAFAYNAATETHLYSMKRFPFNIHYLQDADSIYVVAIAHQRRKPGYWRKPV